VLGEKLHPATAANLAALVRMMNSYYSNLIDGNNTRPRDIERALAGELLEVGERRNLQLEALAHVRVQAEIDDLASRDAIPEPASNTFVKWLHGKFYSESPEESLVIESDTGKVVIEPGKYRSDARHEVTVGRHVPPSSEAVCRFMDYFESRYRFENLGQAGRILAIPASHHRLNFIHPFIDGNGRVSRLMSHAMAAKANIGAHGLWSISRGLARGLASRGEYKLMMDSADSPRRGDLDGLGNLSAAALSEFTEWFLRICVDQVEIMSSLFETEKFSGRLARLVDVTDDLKPEAKYLLDEALIRGQFERGAAARITGLPERSARRLLAEVLKAGLLGSDTPKGAVSLRFPVYSLEVLFPRLFPVT
jgi:Fic family protein